MKKRLILFVSVFSLLLGFFCVSLEANAKNHNNKPSAQCKRPAENIKNQTSKEAEENDDDDVNDKGVKLLEDKDQKSIETLDKQNKSNDDVNDKGVKMLNDKEPGIDKQDTNNVNNDDIEEITPAQNKK